MQLLQFCALKNGVSATTFDGLSETFIATMGVCPAASSAVAFLRGSLLPGAADSAAATWKLTRCPLFLVFASRSALGAVFLRGFATGLEGFVVLIGFGGDSFDGFSATGGDILECFCNGGGETLAGFCGGGGDTFDCFCSFGGGFSARTLLLLTTPNARRVGLEKAAHLTAKAKRVGRTQQI